MHTGRIEVMDRQMAEVLATKTERERLEIAWGMWRGARRMLTNLLTHEHPDWSREEVHREVSRRMASGT